MSATPQSLCVVDESLYISTAKASLMHVIEAAKSGSRVPDLPSVDIADVALRDQDLVVNSMAVLQSSTMKKTATMCTLADLKEAFVQHIENMITGNNI